MTNQQALKKLAGALGKTAKTRAEILDCAGFQDFVVYILVDEKKKVWTKYHPATNPAQAQELQMHYKMSVSAIDSPHTTFCRAYSREFLGEGATPSEAITACAIERIKGE